MLNETELETLMAMLNGRISPEDMPFQQRQRLIRKLYNLQRGNTDD